MKRLNRISASRYDNVPGYEAPEGGYLYIFKHGIGPGTMPSDVHIVKVKDLPNYYTAVWLDSFLTTDEMKRYDIPFETDIKYYLDRIGYCLKDGDVVPCDDVEACDNITSSTISDGFEIGDIVEIHTSMDGWFGEYEVIREAEPTDYIRLSQNYMQDYPGTKYLLKSTEPSFFDETIETPNNMRKIHTVEACDNITASDDFDNDEDEIYWVQAYSSKPHRGLADDFSINDWDAAIEKLVEFANDGYYVMFENLASGEGYEYDPDEVLEAVDFGDIYTLRRLKNLYEG